MTERMLHADVVVAGLGLGAIAAALAVAERGLRVVMAGPESRIGGQVTTQLTSPLDEHPLIETTGCTASYRTFRDMVRWEYGGVANPGGGWVSRLCFPPAVGERVLRAMLAPHITAGNVEVVTRATPVDVELDDDRVTAVRFRTADGGLVAAGDVTIDATETGDLLPLAGADWVVGSEGGDAFGEPHALPGGPDAAAEQSCTIVAALIRDDRPGDVGAAPAGFAELRDAQPFSLTLSNDAGSSHSYAMFDDSVAPGSFWSYRRVHDARQLGGADAAVINWHGNDYYGSGLVADREATDAAARRLAEAFVHWLRTEAPHDDGVGRGYPELRLAPEVAGTADGFAETPYVRESRRLASAEPVTEHDLGPRDGQVRARAFSDSIGIAWYHADLHPRVGGHPSVYAPTAPFQVPLRALVSRQGSGPSNLLAGAKNLAATQIAAAAYRVHPGEWAIGEAAGIVAAYSVQHETTPRRAIGDPCSRVQIQLDALRHGTPIVWATDLPAEHPAFVAGSLLAAHGGARGLPPREARDVALSRARRRG
ncbi:FAD-dependent oxidoreductase [Microbacterium sp. 4R-513]|uniref:FAD-dependent oxidoreductase n=1 Tax=Microbacterium sp. 4R-513 TaxID=2567934 RepID=UPI0013E17388|nr:FAD-dependent oxidoreductase [Microbacterium sp. 4R-513]QIG40963.1 FAD-dependent oxidoreductase [Microbacterium sp. 4R-513]